MIATTLNFDYEVRSAKDAFNEVPSMKIKGEMLELAEHIINTKKGTFDASKLDDRYEGALAELVKAKLEGKKIEFAKEQRRGKVVDLMAALRESAGLGGRKTAAKSAAGSRSRRTTKSKALAPRRKAS